jgi:hypothetical protein
VTEVFDAFHLPAGAGDGPMATLQARGLSCRYPIPTPGLLADTIRALLGAGQALAGRPVAEIVDVIDAAATRFTDPGHPIRQQAERLIADVTGYSPPMASLVLDRMAADWRGDALRRMLRLELADPRALDRFVPAGENRLTRAYGPRLAFHIFAENVPGVAVTSLIRSLLVKAPVLGKLGAGEPVFPVLFARALAGVDMELASALAVTYWPGGDMDAERQILQQADLIVVYGGEEAVRSVRERSPDHARVVIHGPRFSAGLVAAASLDQDQDALAAAIALAVATFDQNGCVSPHAIWLEDPDQSRAGPFINALTRAMAEVEKTLPRGAIEPAEAALIQQERGAAEMRGHAGGAVRVISGKGTAWTVVLDDEVAFRPSCLLRYLQVHTVASLDLAVDALSEHREWLQSVAIAVPDNQVHGFAHRLARAGAARITTFDRLPWPPPEWHHDGQGPLQELLRWVDLER